MQPFTEAQLRQIDARWKSDVDVKLDALVTDMAKYRVFLDILIEREKDRKKMAQAIIEKTIGALIWGALATVGYLCWDGLMHAISSAKSFIK